jgi:hypothetical protein
VLRVFALAFASAVSCAAPALAADYPFQGYFTVAGAGESPDGLDVNRCALNFFVQDRSGDFVAYHADLDHFKATGGLRYVIFQRGRCSYDAGTRIETCTLSFDTDQNMQGKTFIDVIEQITPTHVKTRAFDDMAQAEAFAASGKSEGDFPITYFSCPFDEAKIAGALTGTSSPLDVEARNRLTGPDATLLQDADVLRLVKAMGLAP